MKKSLKILSLLVAITMLVQMFNFSFISKASEDNVSDSKNQSLSIINNDFYYENVSNSIKQVEALRKDKELKDYDVYLDMNGILNIMVYDDKNENIKFGKEIPTPSSSHLKDFRNRLNDYDLPSQKVIYQKVKFSKDYLLHIQEILMEHANDYNIVSVGSGDIKNQVEIELLDISKQNEIVDILEKNIENFDEDAIRFKEADEIVSYASRSYPGRKVYNAISEGTSGFNAKDTKTGKYGVVTVGHVAEEGYTLYNRLDVAIGQPTHWQREKSIDGAFVPFNSGFSPSLSINGDTSKKITGYVKVANILKGMKVSKFGLTTGETSGVVTDPAMSVAVDGIAFTRLVQMEISATFGDSGGPVYLNSSDDGYPKYTLIGIIEGGNSAYTYAIKAGFILATFDLELYTG